jgi:hypothetical protein
MHAITGTWHVLFDINGMRMVDAPIEIVVKREASFNHPPQPITVSLEPATPTEEDVIICRIATDLVLDDLDYDLLRYTYTWESDDTVVREVTSAAHSDVLPHDTIQPGSTVRCTVVPMDLLSSGPSASTFAEVQCASPPEVVSELRLEPINSGMDLLLTWGDTSDAEDYVVFEDDLPSGSFETSVGSAGSGTTGLTVPMPSVDKFYLVAGRDSVCGTGPKH